MTAVVDHNQGSTDTTASERGDAPTQEQLDFEATGLYALSAAASASVSGVFIDTVGLTAPGPASPPDIDPSSDSPQPPLLSIANNGYESDGAAVDHLAVVTYPTIDVNSDVSDSRAAGLEESSNSASWLRAPHTKTGCETDIKTASLLRHFSQLPGRWSVGTPYDFT